MKSLMIGLALLALVACKAEEPKLESGLAGYDPHLVDTERDSCLEKGGRFGGGAATGTFLCYENTPDANQSCSKASDCEGLCLARSRTCAPVKPLFGCNDVLSENGSTATICIE